MKKIMAIDDDAPILHCIKTALSSRGYDVQTSSDPVDGLKTLTEDETIMLAMLDVKMPKKNGFEIYRELRETRKIPVLFVTAYPKYFDANTDAVIKMWKEECADGTTDIIYKPFNLDTLFEKIESLIGPLEKP